MPRPRTRPLTEPNGYEKITTKQRVGCTLTEKLLWQTVFGKGKVSDTARNLLNKEACKRANIPHQRTGP